MGIKETCKDTIKNSNRESNIELLRIFTAMGVIMLHYNYGRALKCVNLESFNFGVLIGLESFWVCAVYLFLLFRNIDIGRNRIINSLAKGSFTVYLTHKNLLPYLQIEKYVNANVILLVGHIFVSVIILYLAGFLAYLIYNFVLNFVEKITPSSIKQLSLRA